MGFDDRMTRGRTTEGSSVSQAPTASTVAPGKRMRTQDLARRTDGQMPLGPEGGVSDADIVSARVGAVEATPCDADGGGVECIFDARERDRLRVEIGRRANAAAINWHAAITDERIELLTKAPTGWNALFELGAMAITAGLGGAAVKMLEWANSLSIKLPAGGHILLAHAMNAPTQIIVGVRALSNVSNRMKAAVTKDSDRDAVRNLLDELREYPIVWADAITNDVAPMETDVGLQALCFLLDKEHHREAFYRTAVHDLISRFETEALAVGKPVRPPGSSGSHLADHLEVAVWLRGYGQQRLALCASEVEFERQVEKPKLRYLRHVFVRWVSPDMVDAATGVQREKFDGEVPEVDVFKGPFLGADRPEVREWLATVSSGILWTDLTGGAIP